ncbi:MAG: L-aspartate oxidase, partial [Hyphomicrobium sp.]
RSGNGLKSALTELKALSGVAEHDRVLSNMLLAARLIAAAALLRKESRGGHYRTDYPDANPALAHRTFITLAQLDAMEAASKRETASALAACGT